MPTVFEFSTGAHQLLRLVIAVSAIGSLIAAGEWLALRSHFDRSGVYAWPIARLLIRRKCGLRVERIVGYLFDYPAVLTLPAMQLVLSLVVTVPGLPSFACGLCCLGIAGIYLLMSVRGVDGFNGGDSMSKVIMLAGGLSLIVGSDAAKEAGLAFIAFQLTVAYSTPGWLRLFDRQWLSGAKLLAIMRLETFGRRAVWSLLDQRRWLARLVATSIAVFESGFGLAVLTSPRVTVYVLVIGACFHVSNAVVMGLNTFVWSFLGAYPAVFWVTLLIHNA